MQSFTALRSISQAPALPGRRATPRHGARCPVQAAARKAKPVADPPPKGLLDISGIPAWFVDQIAPKLYPASECGPGRYLDPNTNTCAYICRPGYSFDPVTKSCRKDAACADGWVFSEEEHACVHTADGGGPMHIAHKRSEDPLPPPSTARPPRTLYDLTLQQKFSAWASKLFLIPGAPATGETESCPVGFYYDEAKGSCVVLCAPGHHFDKAAGQCVADPDVIREGRGR